MTANPTIPTWPAPEARVLAPAPGTAPSFLPDLAYDWATRDLVVGPDGDLALNTPLDSWADWCLAAALVQRGSSILYPIDFGTDTRAALADRRPAIALARLQQAVTAALEANTQTRHVQDWRGSWVADVLQYRLTAVAATWQSVPLTVTLPGMP